MHSVCLLLMALTPIVQTLNHNTINNILDASFIHGVRDTSTLLASLRSQIAHGNYATRKLLAQLENAHRWFAVALGDTQRRRLQVKSRLSGVADVDVNGGFHDDGVSPLSDSYIIIDPLMSAGSHWQRGQSEISKYDKGGSILQMQSWNSSSPSLLMKASGLYGPDDLFIGVKLRPLAADGSSAGIVYAYENERNYHSVVLQETRPYVCTVNITRNQKGKTRLLSTRKCPPQSTVAFRSLLLHAQPREANIWLDGNLVTNLSYEQPVMSRGSVGLVSAKGKSEFTHFFAGSTNTTLAQTLQATPGVEPFILKWSVTKEKEHPGEAQDFEESEVAMDGREDLATAFASKGNVSCYKYSPDVPQLSSFQWSGLAGEWRLSMPSNDLGAMGHELPLPSLRRLADVHSGDAPSYGILRDWSCPKATYSLRMTFLSDGEAGLALRHKSANDYILILIESLSQKVRITRLSKSGTKTLSQVKSQVPILAHESIVLGVKDGGTKLEVTLNSMSILEASLSGQGQDSNRRSGLVVTRGNVAFAALDFRGRE